MDYLNAFFRNISEIGDIEKNVLLTVLTIAVFMIGKRLAVRLIVRGKDPQREYQVRKVVGYLTGACMFLVVGRIWFSGFESLTTYVGLLSAGMAIALQNPLVNIAGWGFIIWQRPFAVGDRIEIGKLRGDVIDQRLFMFSMMEIGNWVDADQSTGRVVHVPNGKLFTEMLANYGQGFPHIWNEIPVLLTFESDWRRAKKILVQICDRLGKGGEAAAQEKLRNAAKNFLIFYTHLSPIVYTSVRDCGVLLTIRYLCEPRTRRGSEQKMWEAILDGFAKAPDIDFAYPTQRFFANNTEGKLGTRPDAIYSQDSGAAEER